MHTSHSSLKEKERPSRKRSPSVIHKVWNFARNASGSKTPPPSSPSSRSNSLPPSSPLLQPTTSAITAPGSILKASHPSPTLSPQDAHTFDTRAAWLTSQINTLTPQQTASQLQKLENILRSPGQVQPDFTLLQPLLAIVCGGDADYIVRQAGFSLLAIYLETSQRLRADPIDYLDYAMVWHLIRSVSLSKSNANDDWEQRLKALQQLTSSGSNIEGLSELVPTLCTWHIDSLELCFSDRVSIDMDGETRAGTQQRIADIQRLLISICSQNISSLSEQDEQCVIVAFLRALECAVLETCESQVIIRSESNDATVVSSSHPHRSPSRVAGLQMPSLGRNISRHKRNSSSQSLLGHRISPNHPPNHGESHSLDAGPTWLFQAAAFVRLFSILSSKAPIPSTYVQPAIQSLLFIVGSIATPLPAVGLSEPPDVHTRTDVDPAYIDADPALLERGAWDLISSLLSSGYGTTTAHEIKHNILAPVLSKPVDGVSAIDARKSRGAARALRLALRQGTQHRLALSRHEDIDDLASYPPIFASELGTNRSYSNTAATSPFLAASQAQDVVGRGISLWLRVIASRPDADAEAVVLECIGIAKDIVDECAALDRQVSDDEAQIVGEILRQAVECLRSPTFAMRANGSSVPRSFVPEAVSALLYSVPLSMPITPSPCDIVLSVAEHIPDSKAVIVVDHIFKEVISFPSAPNWLPTIKEVFAKLHGHNLSLSRRAIAQHIRALYDDVRDLANFRDPLVQCAVDVWEKSLLYEDNDDTIADIVSILSDAIVAGAAEEQIRDHITSGSNTSGYGNGLDQRIVALLVHVANGSDCPLDAQPSMSGSDRGTLHRGLSSDIIADRNMWSTPPPSAGPSRDPSMSPVVSYPRYAPVFTADDDDTAERETARPPIALPNLPNDASSPHEKNCKSMSAVLALILTFNRLAFSPPHSLDSESPFKAARAPASSKCINIFEYLLSLLGPTYTTTALPEGEQRKNGHKQASCRRARLAILQWSVRLRADRDHRLYFKDDLTTEVEAFAQLLARGAHSPQLDPEAPVMPEAEIDARLGRKGRSTKRREPDMRDRSRRSSDSRSRSRYSRPELSTTPLDTFRGPIWSIPDILPFAIPLDASRPSEGMTTYSDQKEREREPNDVMPELWLSVSTYICILTDLMEDESDWEIFSYALCHIPLQLSNKHLFCGPRTRESICNMVSVMCNSILSDRFGGKPRIPPNLRNTDVWGLACQTLTIFVGYRDSFRHRERVLGENLVSAFCHGLNRHISVAKPCLQALAICAYEFENATAKYLPQVLDLLVQVISKPDTARQILELLAILGKMPAMYANLRHSHFDMIFSTAGRYIQRHNKSAHLNAATSTGTKMEGGSFALSQHVLVLAYYVVYIWYLGIDRPVRRQYIPTISRSLWIANHGQSGMDEMTEVCFDWLKRYTAGDVLSRPTQDTVLCKPNERSKSWLLGNALMTIETLQTPGWVGITIRGASGVVHLTVRVDNMATQRFEEIDPLSLVPTGAINNIQDMNPLKSFTKSPADSPSPVPSSSLLPPVDSSFLPLQLSRYPSVGATPDNSPELLMNDESLERTIRVLDATPVVELHKVGVMYVAPGQSTEEEILGNRTGSPAYASFLANLGHIVKLKNQRTVYPGGLDTQSDFDGEFAYVWWDEITQIVFHATTMMPNVPQDTKRMYKKRHVGNDWVRIVWNDSGGPYRFDTLSTEFQLVNIVIEPHSAGITAAYSNSPHENEFFKLTLQRAEGVPEFGPLGEFKLLSLKNLPSYVRQISLLASLFAQVYDFTKRDTHYEEYVTSWRRRLGYIKGLRKGPPPAERTASDPVLSRDRAEYGDFTPYY